jgi:hypothetical protein
MKKKKKNGKVFTSKFVGTGPPSYEKGIYRAVVSQRLRNNGLVCRFGWNKYVRKKNCASSWLFTGSEPRCTVNRA